MKNFKFVDLLFFEFYEELLKNNCKFLDITLELNQTFIQNKEIVHFHLQLGFNLWVVLLSHIYKSVVIIEQIVVSYFLIVFYWLFVQTENDTLDDRNALVFIDEKLKKL